MKNDEKLVTFSIRIEPTIKAELDALARADDRSLSAYVSRVLRQHVDESKRFTRPKVAKSR